MAVPAYNDGLFLTLTGGGTATFDDVTISASAVPEPSAAGAIGLAALLLPGSALRPCIRKAEWLKEKNPLPDRRACR